MCPTIYVEDYKAELQSVDTNDKISHHCHPRQAGAIRLVRAPSLDNPGGHSFGRAEIIFSWTSFFKLLTKRCSQHLALEALARVAS